MGVILSGFAQSVFWPVTASRQYERSLRDLVDGCRSLLADLQQGLQNGTLDSTAITATESKLFSLASSLDAKLQTARADSRTLDTDVVSYQQLNARLFDLFTAATKISGAALSLRHTVESSGVDLSDLKNEFASADRRCA